MSEASQPGHEQEQGRLPMADHKQRLLLGEQVLARVAPISERYSGALPPEFPIDKALLKPEVTSAMNHLISQLDETGDIVRHVLRHVQQVREENARDMYALLLSPAGLTGLTRTELIELYGDNPAVQKSRRLQAISHANGDFIARDAYTEVQGLLMNVVRFERLKDVYDSEDPIWWNRAERIGPYSSSERHMHLEGLKRQTVIRKPSPSDRLNALPPDDPSSLQS